jgi:LacI family transcriptional regulator
MTTINDVARLANVSNATVSHVLNHSRFVQPETQARVEAAIRELGFRPNHQARSLKTGQSYLIGVLTYMGVDIYFSEVLSSIERSALQAGYGVLLRHTADDEADQARAIHSMLDQQVDGLIINSPTLAPDLYEMVGQMGRPCVFLHFYDPACPTDFIQSDDRAAALDATRYLISLGHRRIACLAGCGYEQNSTSQRRIGYEQALIEAGITLRPDYFVMRNYEASDGYEMFNRLCALDEPPSACITYSDLLALGAIRAAKDRGLDVPGDVSIIGFDDIALASYTVPRLTTVYQDRQKIGELAFEQIMARLKDPTRPQEQIILPTRLVIRESTGPVK